MKKLVGVLTGLFLLVGMAGAPANAVTTTLTGTLTSDHCTDGCGPQTGGFGTITVVDNGLGTGGAVGTLAFTGTACQTNGLNCRNVATDPTIQNDVKNAQLELNDTIKPLRFYPVLSLGLSFRF